MADSVKCQFCGGVHGDVCPEFSNFPGVEGSMADLIDVTRIWRCSRMCGKVEQAKAADVLLNEGWTFHSKNGFTWAICPECGVLEHRHLEHVIEKWCKAGSPRGDN